MTPTLFTAAFFAANRQKLYEKLQPGSLLVLTAAAEMQRSLDAAYPFEQEPNFWYLTGVDYPDWLLLVDVDERREWLVAPYVSDARQVFDGSLSPAQANSISGIETVVSKREGNQVLRDLLGRKPRAYTLLPQSVKRYGFHGNPAQRTLVRKLKGAQFEDVRLTLTRQRAIKQPLERQALQRAIDITVSGLTTVLAQLPELRSENEVDALLTSEFRKQGVRHGFEPIISAGEHTVTLHYGDNNAPFLRGDWLLMDVGARYNHYMADITRTVPLGKPTERELELYEALRQDQQTIIQLMQPGADAREYFEAAGRVLHSSFVRLGLLSPKSAQRDIYKIMPHGISHGLGYDPHDPLGRPDKLLPGMVLTAEIGLYLREEGFGLRLEDDIVITEDGPVNMSDSLPTELDKLGAPH